MAAVCEEHHNYEAIHFCANTSSDSESRACVQEAVAKPYASSWSLARDAVCKRMATDLSTPSSQQDISQHARDVESLDSLLDSLLDELAYQHALRQCDDMINYFTGRGPLAKMQNVRDLEMIEYMVLHPLADFTPEERRQIESLSEPERTERIEGIRRIHISGRDAFLDALYNFFGDVDADYEYIRRGGHMLTP